MKFFCDQCNAQYMIADEKVGPKGVKVKCKKCSHIILVKPIMAGDATTVDSRPTAEGTATFPANDTSGSTPSPVAAPRKTESEISGAFDSLFSGDDNAKGGNTWGNQSTTVMTSPLSSPSRAGAAPGGEKEWYVAIDDAQVGPIDMNELAQRWDAKEINEESLAWKGGMPDWVPIADIPDLQHLIKERPQKKVASSAGAAAGTQAGQAAAAKSAASIEWKPSAASALSSLVQEELIAAQAPKEVSAPSKPEGVPDLGMPSFGAQDLFGGKVSSPPPPTHEGFAANQNAAWSVPAARPASDGSKSLYVILGTVGVAVVGILVVLALMVMRQQPAPAVAMNTPPQGAAPAAPTAPATAAAPATPAAAPATPTPPPATPAANKEDKSGADEGDDDGPRGGRHHGKKKGKMAHESGGAALSNGGGSPPPAAPAASVKASLTREDVMGGVRNSAVNTKPCIMGARGRNELPPGDYTFQLNWTINPDGSVSSGRLSGLQGPSTTVTPAMASCFATAMRSWRFPASQGSVPVSNFPFRISIH